MAMVKAFVESKRMGAGEVMPRAQCVLAVHVEVPMLIFRDRLINRPT